MQNKYNQKKKKNNIANQNNKPIIKTESKNPRKTWCEISCNANMVTYTLTSTLYKIVTKETKKWFKKKKEKKKVGLI